MAMERVKEGEVSPTLPYDVMINILSRLPIKSIVRFRCVSKSWLTIYTDPHFVNLHLTQSPKFNIVLICSVDEPSYSEYPFDSYSIATLLFVSSCDDREQTSHFIGLPTPYYYRSYLTEQVSLAGSCRGLVLCCKHSGTLYLVNPSTGEMIRLPESPFHETAASLYASASSGLRLGLGYDSSVDDYKVVQLSPGEIIITCLYSLRSNSWKRIPDFPFSTFTLPGVFLNGNLHWFNSDTSKMACLSLADEKFRDVPLPADGGSSFKPVIGVFRGCLCIQPRLDGSVATFWVMKEYGRRDSWTKFEFTDPNCSIWKPLNFSNNDEDLFVSDDDKFVMYNLNEKKCRNLEFHFAPQSRGRAETCLESVVSPKCYMGKKRSYRR